MQPLKIAIVVHGRFYAFDLARELISQGHDVTLFTNYPKTIVGKFGIPRKYVRSFFLHGLLSRFAQKLSHVLGLPYPESFLCPLFSKWAAKQLTRESWDVVKCFSGVAKELFQALRYDFTTVKILARGSTHIRYQKNLLILEQKRANAYHDTLFNKVTIDQPNNWMITREEGEYCLADVVSVLSSFSYQSFIQSGISHNKVKVLPLGAQISIFRPSEEAIDARIQRISTGQKLRVLMTGTFSLRKGALDYLYIAKVLCSKFEFEFVGSMSPDAHLIYQEAKDYIEFIPRQPLKTFPEFYEKADVFTFVSIEDGYAVVLSEAQASGLPIIATTNCSAPDIVVDGETGWVLPIRTPDAFIERLAWCDEHRQELSTMVKRVYEQFQPRDWSVVADDFVNIVRKYKLDKR